MRITLIMALFVSALCNTNVVPKRGKSRRSTSGGNTAEIHPMIGHQDRPVQNDSNALTKSSYASEFHRWQATWKNWTIHRTDIQPVSCKGVRQVAILLVGNSEPVKFYNHAERLSAVTRSLNADVFSVLDMHGPACFQLHQNSKPLSLVETLPIILGNSLKRVGLVGEHGNKGVCTMCGEISSITNIPFLLLPFYESHGIKAYMQWYKLFEAWKLMETQEGSLGAQYDVVIKMRFDCTPFPILNICASEAITTKNFFAIHACTDHLFWGRRNVMAIAASSWPKILDYYIVKKPRPLERAFSVSALLGTLTSMPITKTRYDTFHYNKVGALPWVDLGLRNDPAEHASVVHAIENLRELLRQGVYYVDPTNISQGLRIMPGESSHPIDMAEGFFCSEKDFLTWVIMHNITVCDLGGDTTKVIFKGIQVPRPSLGCSAHIKIDSR